MVDQASRAAPIVDAAVPVDFDAVDAGRARRTVLVLCALLWFQGFTMSINGIAAPWIAKSFGLGESGIASLYAWISVSAIGALVLSRLADRLGRRQVLRWCLRGTPPAALGAALSANVVAFVLFEIVIYAFIAATLASAVVILAEELPIAARARGQSFAGLAVNLGGGLCLMLMPALDRAGYSWRWLLAFSALGILWVPFVAQLVPESQRWERAAASGATAASRFVDIFRGRYRRRAIPILTCFLLSSIANTAATSWGYFHAVSVVGLSAAAASLMMLTGGAVSMLGFPLGAWTAERFGRVPTVVTFGVLIAAGSLFFYWGPPARGMAPTLWLAIGFAWFMTAVNGSTVAGNAAATELFPTALRGTLIGWFALVGAMAAVSSQAVIAILAERLGGLSVVVGYLGLLTIPSAVIFGLCIEETRGLSLEVSAKER